MVFNICLGQYLTTKQYIFRNFVIEIIANIYIQRNRSHRITGKNSWAFMQKYQV